MRVVGVQHPAEVPAGPLLDHQPDDRLAQPPAAHGRVDVDVGQVGLADAVRLGPREAHHPPGGRLIGADDPPGPVKLRLEHLPGAVLAPIGVRHQGPPEQVPVDARRLGAEFDSVRHPVHAPPLRMGGPQAALGPALRRG
ncbi:hypothetical protein GCM10009605_10460 [Nocardiopsis composta]